MVKKVFKALRNILQFILIVIIMAVMVYLLCKYIIKDTAISNTIANNIDNIAEQYGISLETFNKVEPVMHVELKNENLTNEIEKSKCYYYLQLNENAKTIYMVFENNIENFKNGEENIMLPATLQTALNTKDGQEQLNKDFQAAWDAFSKDKPELFYFDGNKFCLMIKTITRGTKVTYEISIGKGENENYFVDGFDSKQMIEDAATEIQQAELEIINDVKNDSDEYNYSYEKILKVHDWMIEKLEYDGTYQYTNNGNVYGGLVKNNVICEGYAKTFKYLMDKLDVPCIIVCGESTDENGKAEKHAWNYVYLNEKWYAIDCTWDDPIIIGSQKATTKIKYKYFLKGSKTMNKDHNATGEITEGSLIFMYPDLSENDLE